MLPSPVVRALWRLLACAALLLAALGVVLPVLPTVPFLLVAAWAGGRGWPALERWLLDHPRYGASLRRWRERGAVPRGAKWAATGMMSVSATGVFLFTGWPLGVRLGLPLAMACVATWLWLRPES